MYNGDWYKLIYELQSVKLSSDTTFLLMKTPHDGMMLNDAMLRQGVIVRPMKGYGLPNSLRITIGTNEQCERCLEALRHALDQAEAA